MIRAVIIDDEPTTEAILRYFTDRGDLPLEIAGSAPNGKLGVELIRKEDPDLVFLDIQMPVMNGFEVMAAEPDRKYVIITAYDMFDYAQKALRFGAADILLKPIELAQVQQAAARATGWNFTGNKTINEAAAFLRAHYAEKIGLTELADQFYLTPSHMARLFKSHMGESVLGYLNRVRVENARRLLEEGMSIQEASESVGYDSLNNFYKYFKRYTGVTPAEYQKAGK
ncbi:MAG: helix-turn-helix domain-containing protein [Firmicutes bacterium]|nr:helix-turn-helix domain-containing protein [Bacillota bacterium]